MYDIINFADDTVSKKMSWYYYCIVTIYSLTRRTWVVWMRVMVVIGSCSTPEYLLVDQ